VKKAIASWFVLASATLLLIACVQMALNANPKLIPHFTEAFFEECDSRMAAQSLPANLKLMEGLLKNDPQNRQLLTALSMGYTGYSLLFVEDEDAQRASALYLRAKTYGSIALSGRGAKAPLDGDPKKHETLLREMGRDKLEPLFWTTMAWMSWINLNLDQPAALAQIPMAQAYLEKIMELDPTFFYGTPHILMGATLAARPPMLGGDPPLAENHFRTARELSNGKFLLAPYYEARYYAVRAQDKELFTELLEAVEKTPPGELKEVCLINAVIKEKAKRLAARKDELFF